MSKRSREEVKREKVLGPVRVDKGDRVHVYDGPDGQAHADDPGVLPDSVEFPRPESMDEANQRLADERAEQVAAEQAQREIDRENQ